MRLMNLRCEYLTNPLGMDVPRPRLSWAYTHDDPATRAESQDAYRVVVAGSVEGLQREAAVLWDSGWVASDRSTHVVYDGQPLASHQRVYWKVLARDNHGAVHDSLAEAGPAFWQAGIMAPGDWHAGWIGGPPAEFTTVHVKDETRESPQEVLRGPPCQMLRREFVLDQPVARATLYATALGEYEARLNGHRVGDRYLTPEWTDYSRRLLYQTYDVTALLHEGPNVIGALLGDGWYLGLLGPGDQVRQLHYGRDRRFACLLRVELADGTTTEVVTDAGWRLWSDGPVRWADHFLGCTYDARKALPGWDAPGFPADKEKDADTGADAKAREWAPVVVLEPPEAEAINARLEAQVHEPVQVFQTLTPVRVTEPAPGTFIFDLGQNLVGWCEVTLAGPPGTEVRLRHGEMLELDGTLHTANLRLATQTDTFVLAGGEPRAYVPRFTFHGFQYVEVTGLPAGTRPRADFLVAKAIASNPPVTGAFACSNPLLDRLWQNILWTQRDNMASVPTDCPQRNERMGWMGDAQVFAQTAIYNMDVAAFFAKFVRDIRDAQGEAGQYPDFAPHPFPNALLFAFGPGWADAGVIIPWRLYVAYGDARLLAGHYASMKKYVDLIHEENPDYLWRTWGSNYGDWLNGDTLKAEGYPTMGGALPKDVYATMFFAHSVDLLGRIARVLGHAADARRYTELAGKVREAFVSEFVLADGILAGHTQSAYAMALEFGMLPPALEPRAVEYLLETIEGYDHRLSTGFVSTVPLMHALSRRGHVEVAYALAESTRFPSWGYSIDQGATTIWERWDGFVAGRGFQDRGMNSFNHYSIGAVGEWLYAVVLGIAFDPTHPGMKRAIVHPRPGGSVTWARGHYDSIHGRVAVSWHRGEEGASLTGDSFHLEVTVPPNTTAIVHLPCIPGCQVLVDGKPLGNPAAASCELVEQSATETVLHVASGRYAFDVK